MKKTISVLALASIFTAGSAMASGYRIPEQSVDSTSKSGANIASSTRADAAYFNPANMSWISDGFLVEVDATYIHLSSVKYSDYRSPAFNAKSEEENFLLPTGFFVTPSVSGFRVGLALTSPYGLSKRWSDGYAKAVAQEFSLKTYEVNPSLSYNIANKVSLAGGIRMLYADATVKSDASGINLPLSREMSGDTTEWGWNAALSVKPMESLNISTTYRSKIDMNFSDSANLNLMGKVMNLGADVSLPAPAVLAISAGYGLTDNLTLELTWDRTFWSDYKELDFNFTPMIATNPYEKPVDKHWKDSDAIRLSATWNVSKNLDLMAGVAYDKNPVPDDSINFELPDSDAWLFSVGTQWKLSKKLDIGVGLLYDYKETRKADTTSRTDSLYPDGKFTDASALLISAGVNYKF